MVLRRVEQEEEPVPSIHTVGRTLLLAIITGIGIGIGFLIVHKPSPIKRT